MSEPDYDDSDMTEEQFNQRMAHSSPVVVTVAEPSPNFGGTFDFLRYPWLGGCAIGLGDQYGFLIARGPEVVIRRIPNGA